FSAAQRWRDSTPNCRPRVVWHRNPFPRAAEKQKEKKLIRLCQRLTINRPPLRGLGRSPTTGARTTKTSPWTTKTSLWTATTSLDDNNRDMDNDNILLDRS